MYIESADLDAAIRSGIALSAPQTRHQVRMSSSLGAFFADSIRLVLASCQPACAERARPPGVRQGGCREAARLAARGHAERWRKVKWA